MRPRTARPPPSPAAVPTFSASSANATPGSSASCLRSEVSIVARFIVMDIPQWHDLGLPEILTDLIMRKRGLILFVGATGSGKSTSLAAMIDYRNSNTSGHIVTIEDPVEFVHRHKKSIVNQREVGSARLRVSRSVLPALQASRD